MAEEMPGGGADESEAAMMIGMSADFLRQAAKALPKFQTELWALASRAEAIRAEVARLHRLVEAHEMATRNAMRHAPPPAQ